MAVANSFIFGTASTTVLDAVVEGYGNYTAAKRAVESVSIPGRNGDILLDQGYYENVEATFRAVIRAETPHEFAAKVAVFRNAIASQVGYQRLTEAYVPGEYRMAAYESGLDEEPDFIGRAGVFDIKFNCKPQRYLMSGETAQTVASGEKIYNPTPYDASPLLAIDGYGTVEFNGFTIEIDNALFGEVLLLQSQAIGTSKGTVYSFDLMNTAMCNTGDTATFTINTFHMYIRTSGEWAFRTAGVTAQNAEISSKSTSAVYVRVQTGAQTFEIGTAKTISVPVTISGVVYSTSSSQSSPDVSFTVTFTVRIVYDPDTDTLTVRRTATSNTSHVATYLDDATLSKVVADSTKTYRGAPTYIDCEMGEAYKVENGEYISLNQYIAFGSKLPSLASGENEFTLSEHITSLEVTPRWWTL